LSSNQGWVVEQVLMCPAGNKRQCWICTTKEPLLNNGLTFQAKKVLHHICQVLAPDAVINPNIWGYLEHRSLEYLCQAVQECVRCWLALCLSLHGGVMSKEQQKTQQYTWLTIYLPSTCIWSRVWLNASSEQQHHDDNTCKHHDSLAPTWGAYKMVSRWSAQISHEFASLPFVFTTVTWRFIAQFALAVCISSSSKQSLMSLGGQYQGPTTNYSKTHET